MVTVTMVTVTFVTTVTMVTVTTGDYLLQQLPWSLLPWLQLHLLQQLPWLQLQLEIICYNSYNYQLPWLQLGIIFYISRLDMRNLGNIGNNYSNIFTKLYSISLHDLNC